MKHIGPWSKSGNLTDFEQNLLDAATSDRIPETLRLRMSDAFHAHLSALPAATTTTATATGTTSLGAGGGLLFSKTVAIGVASALLVGGAVTWQLSRESHSVVAPAAPPAAVATGDPVGGADAVAAAAPPMAAAAPPQLRDEILALDAAHAALKTSQTGRALELLTTYERRFPNGALVPEAVALRVEALVQSGASERAKQLAQQFLAAYPSSPLAHRVERLAPSGPR